MSSLINQAFSPLIILLIIEICHRSIDLIVALDCSGSIAPWDLDKEIRFVEKLVEEFKVTQEQSRIGLVAFHEKAIVYVNITNGGGSKEKILSALSNITQMWKPYMRTYTDVALNQVVQMVQDAKSTQSHPKLVLLFTDGETSFWRKPLLIKPVQFLETNQVKTFCIGVGPQINFKELWYISKRKDRVFMIQNYTELVNNIKKSSTNLCESP